MQALTIAIGPVGITFLTQQFIAENLASALGTLKPPGLSGSPPG